MIDFRPLESNDRFHTLESNDRFRYTLKYMIDFVTLESVADCLKCDFPKPISAWKGSCVLIQCTVLSSYESNNYLWYRNPVYNESIRQWTGNIVYDSRKSDVNRVNAQKEGLTYSLLLNDLQEEQSGKYYLRMHKDNQYKWMSVDYLSLNISDSGPQFLITPIPVGKESNKLQLSCVVSYYCPEYPIKLEWIGKITSSKDIEIKMTNQRAETKTTLSFTPTWKDHKQPIECVLTRGPKDYWISRTRAELNIEYAPKGVRILYHTTSPTITITEGEEITLECSVESSNPDVARYDWYKDNSQVSSSQTITVHQAGTFYCGATNRIGRGHSPDVVINVQYPPKVKLEISNDRITDGGYYTLTCLINANPPAHHIFWYKDNGMAFKENSSRLVFSSISPHDSGLYECEAVNKLGSEKSLKRLNVLYAPKHPEVIIKPEGTEFVERTEVQFTCITNSSNPEVSVVTWFKNGELLSKRRDNELNDVLHLENLKEHNAGSYKCKAGNVIGSTESKSVSITVLYPPREVKIESPSKVTEGKDLFLRCKASRSYPRVTGYWWYKDGNLLLDQGEEIIFPSVKWNNSGIYKCVAMHSIRNMTSPMAAIKVQHVPVNVQLLVFPSHQVNENIDIDLKCTAQAYPDTEIYSIYKKGVLMQNSQRARLPQIQISESGEYHCMAQNAIGRTKSNVIQIHVSYSAATLGKYIGTSIGGFIVLLILLIMVFHYRLWEKLRRPAPDDSDSHFFVIKKSQPEVLDNTETETTPPGGGADHLNYSTIQFFVPPEETASALRSSNNEPGVIYSVIKKKQRGFE
ncbi:hypothetical protein GDO86_012188, partial [Hymenochirus boettgeri]